MDHNLGHHKESVSIINLLTKMTILIVCGAVEVIIITNESQLYCRNAEITREKMVGGWLETDA